MLRYLGSILIVVIVIGLAAGEGLILTGGLSEREAMRLTVFDGIAALGGDPPRLRSFLEDAETGKPILYTGLVVRFAEGWMGHAWSSDKGYSWTVGPAGLAAGAHDFTIGLPETHPRLDVSAHGTVWVLPTDAPVLWVDAAAIVPMSQGPPAAAPESPSPQDTPQILELLRTLATGREAVYLVAADPGGYALTRRRLAELKVPRGPSFWVRPKDEVSRLLGLKQVWPRADGAVIATATFVSAAERAAVRVAQVPRAGGPEGSAAVIGAWRDAVQRLSASPGPRTSMER